MSKILAITWKELYTTFRDRNLILIMFLTPIVLSTIMGLAFGQLGSDEGPSAFQNIPIAVVNLDDGFNLADQISDQITDQVEAGEDLPFDDGTPTLDDLAFEIGGETVNLGEQLQLNANLNITDADLSAANVSFNFGETMAAILLSEPLSPTAATTGTTGIDVDDLSCPLLEDEETTEQDAPFGSGMTLDDLLDGTALDDPDAARAAVDRGDYVAAVIIPPDFSDGLVPQFDLADGESAGGNNGGDAGAVEVYGSAGQSISAGIVRAVVEGVVNQFVRISVALESVVTTSANAILSALDLDSLDDLDLSGVDPALITEGIQGFDASILDPLACLVVPGAGNIELDQEPLDEIQTRSPFAYIMIVLGGSQAVFFALFTGIFGINSIYIERENWTLQRLVASPTPRTSILAGKLFGNVVVVTAQLVILFISFTVITSLVEGEPTFIWGSNVPALAAVILGIALFVSGLGVLVVGLARDTEQVQLFGPIIAITMGALGGSFGFRLPAQVSGFSPIWWATEALERVSTGEIEALLLPLTVLFGFGIISFAIGTVLFRRRLDL